jgi:hypothetical protein
MRLFGYGIVVCLLLSRAIDGQACEPSSGRPFPLAVQPGKSFLEDVRGHPFFMHGDTAWSLIGELTREEADIYLRDRRDRGFNTLLVSLLEHRFSRNAPANAYGDRPFAAEAFGKVNEAYFKHADWVLDRACELGFVVLLTPSYIGTSGGDEGWYREMAASGTSRLKEYGRFVGRRYGSLGNIVWVQGGDYNPPDKDLVRAVAQGIGETDPDALQTAHNAPDTAALDYWRGEPWLSVNNIYTYGPVNAPALVQRASGGGMPFFLLESAYENEHGADAARVRRQAYQAIFSGASGHVFGNNPIWHFSGRGIYPVEMTWQEALDSPGARSMVVLKKFFSSVRWWELEPDTGTDFLIGGQGDYDERSVTLRAKDGSSAFVYIPGGRGVTLDLSRLTGPLVSADWFDPSNGERKTAPGSPFQGSVSYFMPPRRDGSADWILELNSRAAQGQ